MKYYSELTKQLYETEKEAIAAEKKLEAEKAEAAKKASAKKAEANKVEEAFKARNVARREYNTKVMDARKAYNTALLEAKKAFDTAINDATAVKDKAEEVYNSALKEFTDKHPEGYHMTLKDGDNVITLSRSSDKQLEKVSKEYNDFIDTFVKFFNF
jgi:chromatin segregation and condensation protein Rec8/ScpA/Scc1 (kleisin family)